MLSPASDEELIKNSYRLAEDMIKVMDTPFKVRVRISPDGSRTDGKTVWVATEVFDDMAQAGASKIQVDLSAPSTYNAVTGTPATAATANYTSTVANLGTIAVSGKTYAVVSCNYLLPTDTQTVTVKVLKADDTVIRTITLDNVPLVANKKTQIYGNLVKGELTFNVTINNGFKTEVEEKPVQ
jgi:hypothetical protein